MGIEPTYAAWEAAVLPLNYTRTDCAYNTPPEFSPGPSLTLRALAAQNGPLDRFVRRGQPIELHPRPVGM
jgi:hypothetical protein